jgi:hypothetical protein
MVKGHSLALLTEKQRSKLKVPSLPVMPNPPVQSILSFLSVSSTSTTATTSVDAVNDVPARSRSSAIPPHNTSHSFEILDSQIDPALQGTGAEPDLHEPQVMELMETTDETTQEPQRMLPVNEALEPQETELTKTADNAAREPQGMPQDNEPSIPTPVAPLRQPRITHQMSDLWMRQVNERPVSQPHLKGVHDRWAQIDVSTVQRFTLIYWDAPNEPAVIRCIQDLPKWPKWRLSDDAALLTSLGQDICDIDIYSQKYCVWIQVNLSYTHMLTPESHVFMRRRDVTCLDEQAQIDRFLNPLRPLHFRNNLPAERKAVRAALKDQVCSPSKRSLDDIALDNCSPRRPRLVLSIPNDSPTTTAAGSMIIEERGGAPENATARMPKCDSITNDDLAFFWIAHQR